MSLIPTRLGLRAKLLAGTTVLSLFTAAVGGFAIHDVASVTQHSDVLYRQSVAPLDKLGDARTGLNDLGTLTESHLLEADPASKAKALALVDVEDSQVAQALAQAHTMLAGTAMAPKVSALQAQVVAYRKARVPVLALSA